MRLWLEELHSVLAFSCGFPQNLQQLPLIVDEQLSLVWQILKIPVCLLDCFFGFHSTGASFCNKCSLLSQLTGTVCSSYMP